jgi:hypothetical protein
VGQAMGERILMADAFDAGELQCPYCIHFCSHTMMMIVVVPRSERMDGYMDGRMTVCTVYYHRR